MRIEKIGLKETWNVEVEDEVKERRVLNQEEGLLDTS